MLKTAAAMAIDRRNFLKLSVIIYNAVGFKEKLLMSQMLDQIKDATKSDAQFTWVNVDFLLEQKLHPWYDLPVWVAPTGPETGFSNLSNKKALSRGLTFRSVGDTALATLEWFRGQPIQRQTNLRAGISAEREAQILSVWHAKHKAYEKTKLAHLAGTADQFHLLL